MNRTNILWIIAIIVIIALMLFKPWSCLTDKQAVDAKNSINADSLTGTIDSLVKSNLILATSLDDCQGKKTGHKRYIKPSTKENEESPAPEPSTSYVTPTLSSVSSSAVTNLCGSNDYTEFAVQLNDNSGNWWPQIALDRDQKKFDYSVANTTRDGINFRIRISQFVDNPVGDVCVTTGGKICIRSSVLSDYLGPEKIVRILLLTTGATQWKLVPMSLEGDYYVWQK